MHSLILPPAHLATPSCVMSPRGTRRHVVTFLACVSVATVSFIAAPRSARAENSDTAAIPSIRGADPYVAVKGAAKLADKSRVYRTVFEARQGADKPDQLVPAINMAGSEINTLAAHGVPRKNVKFAIVFHTAPSNDGLLDNAHYRTKYGVDNPNLAVLAELKAAGVELYVCGQELLADKVPVETISPDVTVVEDGLVRLMELANDGYAHLLF